MQTPTADAAIKYKRCKVVKIDLGGIFANVSVANVTCKFAHRFLRQNRRRLCADTKRISGWRKKFSANGEDVRLTLIRPKKRIRTDACGLVFMRNDDLLTGAVASIQPFAARASKYKNCGSIRGIGSPRAGVRAKNTSCKFARAFLHRNYNYLCASDRNTIRGWRKKYVGPGENITLILSKGNKRIRTSVCAA